MREGNPTSTSSSRCSRCYFFTQVNFVVVNVSILGKANNSCLHNLVLGLLRRKIVCRRISTCGRNLNVLWVKFLMMGPGSVKLCRQIVQPVGREPCSSGLVMGGDSRSESSGFKSRYRILDGHFSHTFVVKVVMMLEAGIGPFFKKRVQPVKLQERRRRRAL